MSAFARLGIALLAAIAIAGCHPDPPEHTVPKAQPAAAQPAAPKVELPSRLVTQKDPINWFVDKGGHKVKEGYVNWEAEKQQSRMANGSKGIPTDTIVIHHADGVYAKRWKALSDLQYTRLYVGRYQIDDPDPLVKGWTPHSGHYRTVNGKPVEVFYAYHYLIHNDGVIEDLLKEEEVGWHSNDWLINCRSVAICLDGDHTTERPTQAQYGACARLIATIKRRHKIRYIIGHKDVTTTECPGSWWTEGRKYLIEEASFE